MSFTNSQRIRGTTPDIISAARQLRQNLTPAEKILWQALKNRQLNGWKFRVQHPIESFIVDFYCPHHRLIIELDSDVRFKGCSPDDRHRDRNLASSVQSPPEWGI
ncbi:DUF559 domain-containing protein [Phormidesmis priestleyi ULC007]|uniref:DUF559 domain-containing protein n=1 Tax=Phormidesmis priestleyi ULC007 TaxID=1920490 RepID=A0A2T1D4N1_9CYAN|nr:DUF559 domain-containing protein [Phormidesmis priestleyi ULC007]PZO46169.1 MAG: DUF559 domain-containing protein [Phormidesmis priestleyi]